MSLRARLDKDPWNSNVWEALVEEVAPASAPASQIAQKRVIFEQLLARFPTAVRLCSRHRALCNLWWQMLVL